jgi:F420-non-reducing hydrogenase small subunit
MEATMQAEGGLRPRLAMYWAAACGGCEIAVLNTHEFLLEIDANFDVVFWPVAVDAKYHDVESLPDGYITVCLFNGAIRNDENARMARLLRQKSQLLVAFGSCACEGGIPGLANLYSRQAILDTAFGTATTVPNGHDQPQPVCHAPEGDLFLPRLHDTVSPLSRIVKPDYFMPGCPPESRQIQAVMSLVIEALQGKATLPPAGAVLGAGNSTVCDECDRLRQVKSLGEIRRMATYQPDRTECLLEQGLLCAGPATRSGCEARCPSANVPCAGCYGPPADVLDQGARLLSALASVIDARTEGDVDRVLQEIVDPAGTFYRFGLANSVLRHGRIGGAHDTHQH